MSFCEIFTNYYNDFSEGAAVELTTNNFFSSASLAFNTILNGNYIYAEGEALVSLVADNFSVLGIKVKAEDICYIS